MKISSHIKAIGGLLAIATVTMPLVLTSQAHAYSCKGNQYVGAATKSVKFMAKTGARKSWEKSMKNQFGLEWSVWNIAAGKSVSCHKTGAKHTCQVLARPCLYVVK